jgi:hypothetical protein
MNPTLAGFTTFIASIMGISSSMLSPTDPAIALSYTLALETVNAALQAVPAISPSQPSIYTWAVYNLAGDTLINYASDVPPSTFFADMRTKLGINSFVGGIINSTGDQGTSEGMMIPDAFKGLTIGDLQNLKTPWGRAYLAIAQKYGQLWGLS